MQRRAVAVPGASQSVRQNLALILQLQGKNDEAEKYAGRSKTASLRPAPQPARAQQANNYNSGNVAYQAQRPPQNYQAPQAYQPRGTVPSQSQLSGIPSSERRPVAKQTFGATALQ